MITDPISPQAGRPVAQSECRSWLDQRSPGHSGRRTSSNKLGIIDLIAAQDVEANGQLARHRRARLGPSVPEGQAPVILLQLRIVAASGWSGLDQQEAQQSAALLGQMAEVLPSAAGIFAGNQPQVTGHLLAVGEALDGPQHGKKVASYLG